MADPEVTTATEPAVSRAAGRLSPRTPEAAGSYIGDLFAENGRMVLGLCRLLLRDPVEAEDAAQQVFLSAHQALLRGTEPRDGAAWMAAIARNECRARIRARMREPLELPELPSDLPDPLAAAIHATDLSAIWAALGMLPRRQRNALLLRELGGLSYHELGRALGVSQPAVESLLFRARQHVRALVAGANAAAIPLALREQLAQLIPGFDPTSATGVARLAALPIAWKLASAAVGVGVVATGAGGLHRHALTPPEHEAASGAAPAVRTARAHPHPTFARHADRVAVTHGRATRRHGRGVNAGPRQHATTLSVHANRGPAATAPAQVKHDDDSLAHGGHDGRAREHEQPAATVAVEETRDGAERGRDDVDLQADGGESSPESSGGGDGSGSDGSDHSGSG